MSRLTKQAALLARVSSIMVLLLAPALISQELPRDTISLAEVAARSDTQLVPTITEDGIVYAVGEFVDGVSKIRVSEGATDAYGISAGMLLYRIDEDLYKRDLRSGERKRLLEGWQAVRATWRPRSTTIAAVVRNGESMALILTDSSQTVIKMVRSDSVSVEFLRWSEDAASLFFIVEEGDGVPKLVVWEPEESERSILIPIKRSDVPYLANATDSSLRSMDATSGTQEWIGGGKYIAAGRNEMGIRADSADGLRSYSARTGVEAASAIVAGGSALEAAATAQASSFGTYLGEFDTVAAYSNGAPSYYLDPA